MILMIYKTILCKRKSIKTCLNDGVEISLHKVINSIVAVTKGENIWERNVYESSKIKIPRKMQQKQKSLSSWNYLKNL